VFYIIESNETVANTCTLGLLEDEIIEITVKEKELRVY
jgi:hypothetical protein